MLDRAFQTSSRRRRDRPTLIIVDSHIAWGAPHKQDTQRRPRRAARRGGDPARPSEIYGWPEDAKFLVPDGVYEHFQRGHRRARQGSCATPGSTASSEYKASIPTWPTSSTGCSTAQLPDGWDKDLPTFPADAKGMATRDSSGKVLNALAKNVPWLIGGSADLAPSTKTRLTFEGAGDFEADNYGGRNLHFGIREHAMGAILNGMALSRSGPTARAS